MEENERMGRYRTSDPDSGCGFHPDGSDPQPTEPTQARKAAGRHCRVVRSGKLRMNAVASRTAAVGFRDNLCGGTGPGQSSASTVAATTLFRFPVTNRHAFEQTATDCKANEDVDAASWAEPRQWAASTWLPTAVHVIG